MVCATPDIQVFATCRQLYGEAGVSFSQKTSFYSSRNLMLSTMLQAWGF
jgi:hypothetical protein